MRSNTSLIWVGSSFAIEDADDYIKQVMADEPAAYYKFHSDNSLADYSGNNRDGTYVSPPVTRAPGPITEDDSVANHALLVPAHTEVLGTLPNDLSYNINPANDATYDPAVLYQPGDLITRVDDAPSYWIAIESTQGDHPTTSPGSWAPFRPSATNYPLSLATFTPWTVEFWLKQDMPFYWTINEILLNGMIANETDYAWGFYANNLGYGGVSLSFATGTTYWGVQYLTWFTTTSVLQEWNHIVVTNDGKGTVLMYANAEIVAAVDLNVGGHGIAHNTGATSSVRISNKAAYAPGDYYLAHLAFYSRELCEERIAAHFNAAP